MGQHPFRTGMLTIGMPGSKQGIQPGDITIAEALKPLGYMTAQIGKNHLGDRNDFLQPVHGLDEFYGPGEQILLGRTTDDALAALELDDSELRRSGRSTTRRRPPPGSTRPPPAACPAGLAAAHVRGRRSPDR